jgi:hypothetical protein
VHVSNYYYLQSPIERTTDLPIFSSHSGYKFAIIEMSKWSTCIHSSLRHTRIYADSCVRICVIEIILATLLERFAFAPTEDEVVWNLSQIISPSVRRKNVTDNDNKPRPGQAPELEEVQGLPLVVTPMSEEL